MKNILSWVKSNVLVVVFSAIAIIALPTAFVFSGMWRERIRSEREKAASDMMSSVSKANVTYTIPSYDPTQKPVEYKGAPNSEITRWFKEQRDHLGEAAGGIVKRAEDFNRGVGSEAKSVGRSEHVPMVQGLFPDPAELITEQVRKEMGEAFDTKTDEEKHALIGDRADELRRVKLNEMEEVLLGKKGRPNPYESLLKSINAGTPGDPLAISEAIKELMVRESDKITAGKRPLTPEEQTELTKKLAERRLADYQEASRRSSLYATVKIWPLTATAGYSSIPWGKIDADNIAVVPFFLNQWDYWVFNDVFAAIRLANGDTGQPVGVANAVVKRIESIRLADPEGMFNPQDDAMAGGTDTPAAAPTAAVPGLVPSVPSVSITGRGMGSWNTVYDIRRIEVTVVVSSARINEFLNAITRTNFMTVTDLDLSEVNVWTDLRDGFYYGSEHVVRAKVSIETVWLRSWMVKLMPPKVRTLLGVPGSGDAAAAAPAAAAAAPAAGAAPVSNRGGRGRGGKGGG